MFVFGPLRQKKLLPKRLLPSDLVGLQGEWLLYDHHCESPTAGAVVCIDERYSLVVYSVFNVYDVIVMATTN